MRKNDAITFEIGRRDLEVILGNLSLTIAKMERTQEALKDAADLIRTALQEDESMEEPDCENCELPCVHNPNVDSGEEDSEIRKQIREISEAIMQSESDPDAAEEMLKAASENESEKDDLGNKPDEDTEDAAESLAIELLKAVFSVLADTIENGE